MGYFGWGEHGAAASQQVVGALNIQHQGAKRLGNTLVKGQADHATIALLGDVGHPQLAEVNPSFP